MFFDDKYLFLHFKYLLKYLISPPIDEWAAGPYQKIKIVVSNIKYLNIV
jgi:hypothetical protein